MLDAAGSPPNTELVVVAGTPKPELVVVVDAAKIEVPEDAGVPKTDPVAAELAKSDPDPVEAGVPKGDDEAPPNTEVEEVVAGAPANKEPPDAGAPNEEPNEVACDETAVIVVVPLTVELDCPNKDGVDEVALGVAASDEGAEDVACPKLGTTMAGVLTTLDGVIVRVDTVGAEVFKDVVTAVIVMAEFLESAPKSDGLALAAEAEVRENSPLEKVSLLAGVDETTAGTALRDDNALEIVLETVGSELPDERLGGAGITNGSVLIAVATEKLGRVEDAVAGSDLMTLCSELPNKPVLEPNRVD